MNKHIDLQGLSIHYKEKNSLAEKTILCLHALGHSSKDYDPIFEDIAFDRYRIIAIDFPSHGKSEKGIKPVSSEYYSQITQEFIDSLGLNNITILGNSIGGAVATRLASKIENQNRIESIQLANPAGYDKGGISLKLFVNLMVWFFKKGESKHRKFGKWFAYYYNKVLPSAEARERKNEIVSSSYEIAPILVEGWKSFKLPSENLKNIIPTVHCPVLVTWAMKDKKVQYKRNIDTVNKIENLELIKYDIGHTPMLENSKQFLYDLKIFLGSENYLRPSL